MWRLAVAVSLVVVVVLVAAALSGCKPKVEQTSPVAMPPPPPTPEPPAQIPPTDAGTTDAGQGEEAVEQTVSHGEEIDVDALAVEGKYTVVDFFSEYCPPCVALSPKLEELVEKRDDVVVVKVDINRPGHQGIDWQSPVARQYGLDSIPRLRVYGLDGKMESEGDEAMQTVMGWMTEAGVEL